MSDTSQGPGWWQASDGKWYPPESAPDAPPQSPPPPGGAPGHGGSETTVFRPGEPGAAPPPGGPPPPGAAVPGPPPGAPTGPFGAPAPPPPPGQGVPLPPGYGAPTGTPRNNGKCIASLVLGIASIVVCYLGFLASVPAIVLGIQGRREVEASGGMQTGSGMGVAGIVTGAVGLFWLLIVAAVVLILVFGDDSEFSLALRAVVG